VQKKIMRTDSAGTPSSSDCSIENRTADSHAGWLIPAVLMLLWIYAVYRLGTLWYSNTNYSFGWFVPVLCLALFWERWKCRPAPDKAYPASGTFLLLGAFGLVLLPGALFLEVIPIWRFAGWIFACSIAGITITGFYFWGGRSWSRHFLFPILFFLIAVPWPTRLESPLIDRLSHLNAAVSVRAANFMGTPAVRHGTVIETASGLVGVDNACSGIRSFQASVMVALFLGELFSYTFFRRMLFLFGGVAMAFGCNVIRTTFLVRTCDLQGLAAVNLRHDQAGFTILCATLAGLLVLAWLLRPRKSRRRQDNPPAEESSASEKSQPLENIPDGAMPLPSAGGASYVAPALIGLVVWIVIVETGMEFWFHPAEKQAVGRIEWKFKFPAQSSEFSEGTISEGTRAILNYDEGKTAQWRDSAGRPWQAFYFDWLPTGNRYRATMAMSQARGHSPDVCFVNAGMILQTNLGTDILNLNGVRLRVTTERFLDAGRSLDVASCYWTPNQTKSESGSVGVPSTSNAIRTALHSLVARDRGRFEQRVIKVGVWDMDTDKSAESALRECLLSVISK
jgi:exosortase